MGRGSGVGGGETGPALLLFHLRLFVQKEGDWGEEWERNKENENAKDEKERGKKLIAKEEKKASEWLREEARKEGKKKLIICN